MKKNVLVVDRDERQIRRIAAALKQAASETGCRMDIFAAATVKEATYILEKTDIDTLILDVVYGEEEGEKYPGFAMVEKLRKREKYIPLPVIFVTSEENLRLRAYQDINCLGFLPRKFQIQELLKVILKAMEYTTKREEEREVIIRVQGVLYPVKIKDILYAEVTERNLIIYLVCGENLLLPNHTLLDLSSQLDSFFLIRCSKNRILNRLYIQSVDDAGTAVFLKTRNSDPAQKIPVGKRYKEEVQCLLTGITPRYTL